MIPQTNTRVIKQAWQTALANTIKDPEELLSQLGLSGRLDHIDDDIINNFHCVLHKVILIKCALVIHSILCCDKFSR